MVFFNSLQGGVISWLDQLYLELWLGVNPNAACHYWRNAHIRDGKFCHAGLEAMPKVHSLCDVCVSAKLPLHGERCW